MIKETKSKYADDVKELVDLGLSSGTLWATGNIGSTSPYDYGDYFAWGETSPKSNYSSSTYKYGSSASTFTKYNSTDGLLTLEPCDDAATVNWGSDYRMPTVDEIKELCDECTWTLDTEHNGYEVTGSNGNSIFFPASGWASSSPNWRESHHVCYYSSTAYAIDSYHAYELNAGSYGSDGIGRWYGEPIRPVGVKKSPVSSGSSSGQGTDQESGSGSSSSPQTSEAVSNHEVVNLGLSVKWATCNVGATSPYESGDYFAWGVTDASNTSALYSSSDLEDENDAATANWGSSYRMPTKDEFVELVNNCTWTFDATNGGYLVTSKTNGNSIFLSAAGYYIYHGSTPTATGVNGSYWSKTADGGYFSYNLHFQGESNSIEAASSGQKFDRYPIRPVTEL